MWLGFRWRLHRPKIDPLQPRPTLPIDQSLLNSIEHRLQLPCSLSTSKYMPIVPDIDGNDHPHTASAASTNPYDHFAAMDHSTMDHGSHSMPGMDHGSHGMPGHSMPGMDHSDGSGCQMSMVWNTEYKDLCLVFPQWKLTTPAGLYLSLIAIVGLGMIYEWLRLALKRLDRRLIPSKRSRGGLRGSGGRINAASLKQGGLASSLQGAGASNSSRRGLAVSPSPSGSHSQDDDSAPLIGTDYDSKAKRLAVDDSSIASLFRM